MNHYRAYRLAPLALALAPIGCWDHDPCDPGQKVENDWCLPAPEETPDAGDEATDETTGSPWGKACRSDAECAGDAPVCAPAPFSICTNMQCHPGEANAGICPEGWTCINVENVSGCAPG